MKQFNGWGRRKRTLPDSRPCKLCGLAPRIRINNNLGRYCLYYGTRIPEDEAREITGLRKICIEDGNHFVWPVQGYTAKDLLAWKMTMTDWRLKRTFLKVAIFVALLSLALTPFGVVFSPYF